MLRYRQMDRKENLGKQQFEQETIDWITVNKAHYHNLRVRPRKTMHQMMYK